MVRYISYILIAVTLFGCKKKTCEQVVLPDTIVSPTFENNISGDLVISIKNSNKDTTYNFDGYISTLYNGAYTSRENFETITYNGFNNHNIFSSNYLNLANNSSWQLTSPLVGNFNYIDNRLSPQCDDAANLNLNTCSALTGIILNLNNIQNTDLIRLEVFEVNGGGAIIDFVGTSVNYLHDTIYSPFNYININSYVTITLSFIKTKDEIINGVVTKLEKRTTYKYMSKRIG